MNIVVSGASGLVGSALVPELEAAGHNVRRLVRRAQNSDSEIAWSLDRLDPHALGGTDAVIHLAGRNVGTLWTPQAKRDILDSRVRGTHTIATAVAESFRRTGKPDVLLSVSAIGCYGNRGDQELTESSLPGTGFLAEVAMAWESAASPAAQAGVRVVIPRIGVVLSSRGGALKRLLLPFQLGLGGPVGDGRQWMSWIVLEDLVHLFIAALADSRMKGPINAVAPQPVTNREFVNALARALHRPAIFPLPAFIVKTVFGEMGREMLLASQRVVPEKLQQLGFKFRHPEIGEAMQFAARN